MPSVRALEALVFKISVCALSARDGKQRGSFPQASSVASKLVIASALEPRSISSVRFPGSPLRSKGICSGVREPLHFSTNICEHQSWELVMNWLVAEFPPLFAFPVNSIQ